MGELLSSFLVAGVVVGKGPLAWILLVNPYFWSILSTVIGFTELVSLLAGETLLVFVFELKFLRIDGILDSNPLLAAFYGLLVFVAY